MKMKLSAAFVFAVIFAASWSIADMRSGGGAQRARSDGAVHVSQLQKVSDCDGMMDYVGDVILNTLLQQRYSQGWWRFPWLNDGTEGGSPSDYTSTNTQEAGIDELDIVKTNGTHIWTVSGRELVTLMSWPVQTSEIIDRTELEGSPLGLLLSDDRIVVFSAIWDINGGFPRYWNGTRLDIFDVSAPGETRALRSIEIEGNLVAARLIDGHIYAVIMSQMQMPTEAWDLVWRVDLGLPELSWDATDGERAVAIEEARRILKPLVDDLIDKLAPSDVLPLMRLGSTLWSDPVLLLGCEDLFRTNEATSYNVLSVLHLDLNDPSEGFDEIRASGIFADGWTVYASAQNLYIAQSSWWWWRGWGAIDMTTDIHAFRIGASVEDPVRYSASGEVPGWIEGQFAMSEYDSHLRVASTLTDWWWGVGGEDTEEGSVVTILRDNSEGVLKTVGQLTGIAPGEQLYASRMIGERGYLVTFERIDPLFTLDLKDPTDPKIVGELKIPGFSSYIHPLGDEFLLTVGMAGEDDGTINGLAVNLFDVSDLSDPQLRHSYHIENDDDQWSWSEALSDHHAFTFHRDVLSIPAYLYDGYQSFSGLVVLGVDVEAGFTELGWVDHADLPGDPDGWNSDIASMRRSLYIEDNLFSLSDRGFKVNLLEDPTVLLATVPFFE